MGTDVFIVPAQGPSPGSSAIPPASTGPGWPTSGARRLQGLEAGRYVRLRVSDTEEGMPKDMIDCALLPTAPAEVAAPETGSGVAGEGRGESVLVVEDEDAMREVTRRMLSRAGYEVVVAAGGRDALALAADDDVVIDLLLSDVMMPHMLGKEVAERVQAIRPSVPVLYMSSYAQLVLASQGTLDPGVTLIEKPFSAAELLVKVREILAGPGEGV